MATQTLRTRAADDTHNGDDSFHPRREAAEKLRVSIETLKRYEKSGRLKAYRVGPKLVRYKASDIAALLK